MGTPLGWHRRQALVLASQLPESQADALLVLQAARELVEKFLLDCPEEPGPLAANILPFGKY
jgi:hypothetical protein